MKERTLLLLAGSFFAVGICVLSACDRTETYLYSGQRVDEANACVDAYTPLDIIDGPGVTQDCRVECFLYRGTLYVSRMCPPLPTLAEGVNENDPRCIAARAAAETSCTAGEADEDGGDEADSGTSDAEADN